MINLDTLDTLRYMCEAIDPDTKSFSGKPLDPSRFKAYAKAPSEIAEDTMRDIAAVIDGKLDIEPPDAEPTGITPVATPSTVDRLLNSIVVVYITDRGIPVAAANIIDPTVESYRGFVPLTYYSLESGYNLDGRVQQEFFAVADEYRDQGVGHELKAQIAKLGTPTFILVDSDDQDSIEGVSNNGYKLICEMPDADHKSTVLLWIDHVPPEEQESENI